MMRVSPLAAAAALLCCCAAVAASGQAEFRLQLLGYEAPELAVSAAPGGLVVTGLRYVGPSLRVLLLEGGSSATSEAGLVDAAALDFDQTFDRAAGSWVLSIRLPGGSAPASAARLDVWCRACRAEGSTQQLHVLLSSQHLQQPSQQAADTDSVVVIVLDSAQLPAAAGAVDAAAAARRLQQAGCSLAVGGTQHTFASCAAVPTSGSYSMTVHATVEPAGTGSKLRLGLAASAKGGWAGWALPLYPASMLGASAVIVWPTAAGAEVAGFKLPSNSYDVGPINAAKGSFPIADAAAEKGADGELRAVCTVALPNEAAADVAAAPINYIFAIGPMNAAQEPGLGSHAFLGYSYGSGMLEVAAGTGTDAVAGAGGAAPPPAPTPAAASSAGAGGATPTPTPTPEADGVAVGAGTPGCTLALAQGGARQAFTGCSLISGVGTGFHLLWKAEPLVDSPSRTLLTFGLNASTASGYVAVGFPSRPGRMTDATAMILQACAPGPAGCGATGAKLQQWYMSGTQQSDVKVDSRLAVSSVQAAVYNGQLVGSFQLEVDTASSAGGRKLLLLQNADGSQPFIFAAGPVSTDGLLLRHFADAAATLPVAAPAGGSSAGSTTSSGVVEGGSTNDNGSLKAAHAWMAVFGWGVLVPCGIVLARSFKDARPPLWFHLHRLLQASGALHWPGSRTLGFVVGTVALGLGFALNDGQWETDTSDKAVHRNLGVACTVLGATQFSAVVWRPKKGERYRLGWELWHHWVGRATAAVAIANIYWGTIRVWDLGVWPWACYTAVLAAIAGVSVIKDASGWLRAHKGTQGGGVQLAQPALKTPPTIPPPQFRDRVAP